MNGVLGYDHTREPFFSPDGDVLGNDSEENEDNKQRSQWSQLMTSILQQRASIRSSEDALRLNITIMEVLEHIDLLMDTILLMRVFVAAKIHPSSDEHIHAIVSLLWPFTVFYYVSMLAHHFFRWLFWANHLEDLRFFKWFSTFYAIWDPAIKHDDLLQYDKVCSSYSISARFVEDLPQTIIAIIFLAVRNGDFVAWFLMIYSTAQFIVLSAWQAMSFELGLSLKAFMRRRVTDRAGEHVTLDEWLRENAPPNRWMHLFLVLFFASGSLLFFQACNQFSTTLPTWIPYLFILGLSHAILALLFMYTSFIFPSQSFLHDYTISKWVELAERHALIPAHFENGMNFAIESAGRKLHLQQDEVGGRVTEYTAEDLNAHRFINR